MTVDIHTAWRISVNWCVWTIERWLIDLSQCCRGRIRPGIHPHDRSRKSQHRSPYRAIDRARSDAVQAGHDPLVLVWIYWFIGFDIIPALSIAYRVQNKRRPALRFLDITGRVEHLGVEPAEDIAASPATEPQRVVGVASELKMVSREAKVDQRELPGLGIIHRRLPP